MKFNKIKLITDLIEKVIGKGPHQLHEPLFLGNEVKYIQGQTTKGLEKVLLTPQDAKAANYAFDVTPARLVTALITERGVCAANQAAIAKLFPDKLVIKPS